MKMIHYLTWSKLSSAKVLHSNNVCKFGVYNCFISDNYPRIRHHYDGFHLYNQAGLSCYQYLSLDECQLLCQITDQCLYFNANSQQHCCLKYGVGEKGSAQVGRYFGNKYSSGDEL